MKLWAVVLLSGKDIFYIFQNARKNNFQLNAEFVSLFASDLFLVSVIEADFNNSTLVLRVSNEN